MRLMRFHTVTVIAIFTTVSLFGGLFKVTSPVDRAMPKAETAPLLGEVKANQEEGQPQGDAPQGDAPIEAVIPPEEAVALPQPYTPNIAEVIVPNIPDKKDEDKKTDTFLKGAFCVISALFFIASYIIVKSNEGQPV